MTYQQRTQRSDYKGEVEVWMELIDHKKLQKLMVIQGVSTRGLAKGAGFKSWAYVGRLVRGEVKTLTPETAVGIATFLGVGIDDLFLGRLSTDGNRNVTPKRTKAAA
jgi:hypothetical protein